MNNIKIDDNDNQINSEFSNELSKRFLQYANKTNYNRKL